MVMNVSSQFSQGHLGIARFHAHFASAATGVMTNVKLTRIITSQEILARNIGHHTGRT